MAAVDSQQQEDIWKTFCPLRDEVRRSADAGVDCDNAVMQSWQDMRNHLVAKYYYLVQRVAESLGKKITEVETDALASMGVDGLYDAVDGFDPELLIKFETYAVHRIRGSIIDTIRREDWVPRLARSRAKKLDRLYDRLLSEMGRAPNDEELAGAMGLSMPEYKKLIESSTLRNVQSLNVVVGDSGNSSEGGGRELMALDCLCDRSAPDPLAQMMQDELKAKLFGKGFTPLEKRIIENYYFEARSMKDIAESIGLSESRVSQMNTSICARIKERVRRNPEFFGNDILMHLKD